MGPPRSRGCEPLPGKTWVVRGGGRWKEKPRKGREEKGKSGEGGGGRKQRVIDFCRGFARRYPLYPRLCGPVQGGLVRAVKRRRRASRRRPPIGGSRPQGAALITRPCNTVSLSAALASKPLYRASLPPIYIPCRPVYDHQHAPLTSAYDHHARPPSTDRM